MTWAQSRGNLGEKVSLVFPFFSQFLARAQPRGSLGEKVPSLSRLLRAFSLRRSLNV